MFSYTPMFSYTAFINPNVPNHKTTKGTSLSPNEVFDSRYYDIDYDVVLSNGKKLQREFCWTLEQKQNLIISIFKGIHLPKFIFIINKENVNKKGIHVIKVIDGKQRLSTIQAYMNNEFPLKLNNSYIYIYYSQLDNASKQKIWDLDLNAQIYYEYSDNKLTDSQLIDWFEMVNFGGTPQDEKHLNYLKSK